MNKRHQTEIIRILKEEDKYFKDNIDRAWVMYSFEDHKAVSPVESKKYQQRIYQLFFKHFNETINIPEIGAIIKNLEAFTVFECKEKPISLRVAKKNGKLYYDLSNESFEIVEVSRSGWKIISSDKVLFKRYSHQKPQATPLYTNYSDLNYIQKYFNVPLKYGLLFTAYLISCFIPHIQHPIMILHGESGQGKSTIAKWVKDLVDPCEYTVQSLPQSEEDLFMSMDINWLIAFDNLSIISDKISDDLCKIVTGIALQRRKLYSQDEMITINLNNSIILNGIENVAIKEDLLNRSIIFQVKRGKKSIRPIEELEEEFEAEKPLILGTIFSILATAIDIYPTVKIHPEFRMAGFAKWCYAIAEAMGNRGNEFLEQYRANIKQQEEEAIDGNTFLKAIMIFMEKRQIWIGSASELLKELQKVARTHTLDMHSPTMPKSSSVLTKKLKAYKSLLEKKCIQFSHRRVGNGSEITLK